MLHALPICGWRTRRKLAAAFVGEITGILRSIEDGLTVQDQAEDTASNAFLASGIAVPRCPIYEANAQRITAFDRPLIREIAYFYTCTATLSERLRSLSSPSQISAEEREHCLHLTLADARGMLDVGNDLLRHLRPFVSRRRPRSISRA
jgi:hypothetical protein